LNGVNSFNINLFPGSSAQKEPLSNGLLPNFKSFLNESISEINKFQLQAEKVVNDFAIGKTDNIHEVLLTAEKADIALQFTMQIRNKILDAYNEIMRMQV